MDAPDTVLPAFCPVFILPDALNARAEDAAAAIVALLLAPPPPGLVIGPLFIIDGHGMVDLRESFAERLHGRRFAAEVDADSAYQSAIDLAGGQVVGEGSPRAAGMAAPLMIEIGGHTALASDLPASRGAGLLVACADAQMMLSLALRHGRGRACYVQADSGDMPLARLLGALLAQAGGVVTAASAAPGHAWLAAR
ncbi:hypothetical protein SAMN05428959_102153 [Duganella sp. CF517]|uniref:hypothetical protein n=1 Tax=Duganella sp. CF517 TaxID=1881038 RepID=UPI0008AE0217|nr:hypothetical protein [Duganella sp. CF517]SEN50000.1 hypothetical protein SAMN05428959_102153 [Duganella sp. CF517]